MITVRLNDTLDKAGLGFYDTVEFQEVRPKEFGKGQSFQVKQSPFIAGRIRTGELIVVKAEQESPQPVDENPDEDGKDSGKGSKKDK